MSTTGPSDIRDVPRSLQVHTPTLTAFGIIHLVDLMRTSLFLLALLYSTIALAQQASVPADLVGDTSSAIDIEIVPKLGHGDDVSKLAISDDGRWVLSGDKSGGLILWDLETARSIRSLKGHNSSILGVAFLPGNRHALSASTDESQIIVWDLDSGKPIEKLNLQPSMGPFEVHPSENSVISAVYQSIISFDLQKNEKRQLFDLEDRFLTDLEVSGNGLFIATVSFKGIIQVRTSSDGKLVTKIELPKSNSVVVALAISHDGSTIAVTRQQSIYFIDRESKSVNQVTNRKKQFGDVIFIPDSNSVAVQYNDGLSIFNTVSREEEKNFALERLHISGYGKNDSLSFVASHNALLAAGDEFLILQPLDEPANAPTVFTSTTSALEALAVGPSLDGAGTLVATSADLRGSIDLWDPDSGQLLISLTGKSGSNLVQTSDGQRIVVSTGFPSSRPFDVYDFGEKRWISDDFSESEFVHWTDKDESPEAIAIDGDNSIIYTASEPATDRGPSYSIIRAWSIDTGELLNQTVPESPEAIVFIGFNPVENSLLVVQDRGHFVVYESDLSEKLRSIHHQDLYTYGVAFNTDYTRAYVSGQSFAVVDLQDLRLVSHLEHTDSILDAIAYSGSGNDVIVGGAAPLIREWDFIRMIDKKLLDGHIGSVTSLAVVGDKLLSIGTDGTLRYWSAKTGQLIATSISDANGEWLTVLPSGYFAASPRGTDLLQVVRGRQTIDIEAFAYAMERPDLVHEELAGDTEGLVQRAKSSLDVGTAIASGPAPKIEILNLNNGDIFEEVTGADNVGRKVPVKIRVTDAGGGVGPVEWRVGSERQIHRTQYAGLNQPGESRSLEGKVPVSYPETIIEVTAFNAEGLVSSKETVTISVGRDPSKGVPNLYVIAVGVSNYADENLYLPSPKWDVKAIKYLFEHSENTLFDRVKVIDLVDEEATIENIGQAFKDLSTEVHPRDSFIFYVSGHGKNVQGSLYILPGDYKRTREPPETSIVAQGFSRAHRQEWFQDISALRRIEIYDVCDAASLAGEELPTTKSLSDSPSNSVELNYFASRLNNATGNLQIFAAQEEQEAIDGFDELDYSLFTYAFLDAFVNADETRDGKIDLIELREHLRDRVSELAGDVFNQVDNIQTVEIIPPHLENERDYFFGNKIAIIPKFEKERATESPPFIATHRVIRGFRIANALDKTKFVEIEVGTYVAVEPRQDDMFLIRTQDAKFLGSVDPDNLEGIPGRR